MEYMDFFEQINDETALMNMIAERKEGLENILKEWAEEAGKRPLGYKFVDLNDKKEMIIYTDLPGVLIGLKGCLVNKYKQKINDYYFEKDIEVKFEEIDGIAYF